MTLDKKATTNKKSGGNKYFQYATTVALNHREIDPQLERVSNIRLFINKYNWDRIKYPSKIFDWKKFEKNNQIIALNVLYIKKWEYVLPMFQKITRIKKDK